MDAKALAKSKRAHSLHHSKKNHQYQTSKAPLASSVTASGGKKQTGKQERVKANQSQGARALPTNWDRYEEEVDSGLGDISQESTNLQVDVVAPKSKGADYAHLLSEANAQSQANYSSDFFPEFADIVGDFTQGLGPLLSVKGQSILSWSADDDFQLEDKEITSNEASFLSLNLHTLGEQLAKAKLSERLFIGADVLPPELLTDDLQASFASKHEVAQLSQGPSVVKNDPEGSLCSDNFLRNENVQDYSKSKPSTSTMAINLPIAIPLDKDSEPMKQRKDEFWQSKETHKSTAEKYSLKLDVDSAAKRPSRFEAANSEAELDMLLESFSEVTNLESDLMNKSYYKSQEKMPASLFEGISSLKLAPSETAEKGPNLIRHAMMPSGLDDTIDSLLEETSTLIDINDGPVPKEMKAAPLDRTPSSSDSISKSKPLDDFDSWLNTI